MRNDDHRRRLYEQCVETLGAPMFRVALRLSGCIDTANELVQETFLIAWKDLAKLNDQSKIRSWMFSILHNQYKKLSRQAGRVRPLTDDLRDELTSEVEGTREELRSLFQDAFARLEIDHQMPLLLVSMEGLSVETAAEVLGIPSGTVLSRLHRGRQKLKSMLERMLGDPAEVDRCFGQRRRAATRVQHNSSDQHGLDQNEN